jgi:hypothetical protein
MAIGSPNEPRIPLIHKMNKIISTAIMVIEMRKDQALSFTNLTHTLSYFLKTIANCLFHNITTLMVGTLYLQKSFCICYTILPDTSIEKRNHIGPAHLAKNRESNPIYENIFLFFEEANHGKGNKRCYRVIHIKMSALKDQKIRRYLSLIPTLLAD